MASGRKATPLYREEAFIKFSNTALGSPETTATAGSDGDKRWGADRPAPRNDLCKRPLGQGKRNFDLARRGSYLYLAFGGRPRAHVAQGDRCRPYPLVHACRPGSGGGGQPTAL